MNVPQAVEGDRIVLHVRSLNRDRTENWVSPNDGDKSKRHDADPDGERLHRAIGGRARRCPLGTVWRTGSAL